jgi:hypothetical protein
VDRASLTSPPLLLRPSARLRAARLLQRRPLLAEAVLTGALAGLLAVIVVRYLPAGPDVPAHLFRRELYLEHGFSLWNNLWYAGQYAFVTYSLLYYPLAAAFGLDLLAVLSVAAGAAAFTVLVRQPGNQSTRWASICFAVVWAATALTGALPFALGMAFALPAMSALRRRSGGWFAVLAMLSLLASPLSFLFLALPVGGLLVTAGKDWRWLRVPVLAIGVAGVLEVMLWRLFPNGGRYPFWSPDFAGAVVFAAIGAAWCWTTASLRRARWTFVGYGVVAATLFVMPSEIGANVARIRLVALPMALVFVAARRWRPILACAGLLAIAGWWNVSALTDSYSRSSVDTSAAAAYWEPAVAWVHGHLTPGYRVEAVDTSAHWPAARVAGAGIPLVRGWYRQADYPENEVLYGHLDSAGYLAWLRQAGARYVLLSDAPPDFSATAEADLLRSGASGLPAVTRVGAVTIYEVPDPQPIVTGPGTATVEKLTASDIVVRADRAGTYRVAVRWSPYWRTTFGCMAPGADGMTALTLPGPGTASLDLALTASNLWRVAAGSPPPSC